jgi:hypothetical protein
MCVYGFVCIPPVVGCRRPPVPVHGTTEGVFHNSGAQVIFSCDPGFKLRGVRTAVCLRDGTWSAPAPQCGKRPVRERGTERVRQSTMYAECKKH